MTKDERRALIAIHSALSRALGDTDPAIRDDMTDDEIRQDMPVFFASQHLAELIGEPSWDDSNK